MRSMGRSEGMGVGGWIVVVVGVLVISGAAALAVYGSTVRPQQHEVQQVLPNDRFPS
jgi:hypothetical protein